MMSFTKAFAICLCTLSITFIAQSNAQQETATSFLEGSNWQLVKLTVTGGYEFIPDDPNKYVLNFRSENRLTGTSDCNRIQGTWHHAGNEESGALHFDPFAAGRSLCPPGSLHNNFALNLRSVVAYELRSGNIFMTTNYEGVLLEFERR